MDPLSTSFLGREGSGEAQVFGPDTSFNLQRAVEVKQDKLSKDLTALKREKDLAAKRRATSFNVPLEGWDIDMQREILKDRKGFQDLVTDYYAKGIDPTNPNNFDAYAKIQKAKEDLITKAASSTQHKAIYLDALKKYESNPDRYKEKETLERLKAYRDATSVDERIKMGQDLLIPSSEDPVVAAKRLPAPVFQNKIENGEITTTTGGLDKTKADKIINDWLDVEAGQEYIDKSFGGDRSKAYAFVYGVMDSQAKKVYEKAEDEPKRNSMFGFGFSKRDDGSYNVRPHIKPQYSQSKGGVSDITSSHSIVLSNDLPQAGTKMPNIKVSSATINAQSGKSIGDELDLGNSYPVAFESIDYYPTSKEDIRMEFPTKDPLNPVEIVEIKAGEIIPQEYLKNEDVVGSYSIEPYVFFNIKDGDDVVSAKAPFKDYDAYLTNNDKWGIENTNKVYDIQKQLNSEVNKGGRSSSKNYNYKAMMNNEEIYSLDGQNWFNSKGEKVE